MCNRLPEINKNGDAGIFPVYYSLNYCIMENNKTGVVDLLALCVSKFYTSYIGIY